MINEWVWHPEQEKVKYRDVYAGNGGDGGDGSYQKLFHIPFFGGGSGGNGGNGAKGGNVIKSTREECKIYMDETTFLIPGEGGNGGNMSRANPDYWLYRGWNGNNGKDGKDGVRISK